MLIIRADMVVLDSGKSQRPHARKPALHGVSHAPCRAGCSVHTRSKPAPVTPRGRAWKHPLEL